MANPLADFPNDFIFGTHLTIKRPAGDYEDQAFFMLFNKAPTGWICNFSDEVGNTYGLEAFGETEREAYDRLLNMHTILNGGVQVEIVHRVKPLWDNYFDEDGHLHPVPVQGDGLTDDVLKQLSDYKEF